MQWSIHVGHRHIHRRILLALVFVPVLLVLLTAWTIWRNFIGQFDQQRAATLRIRAIGGQVSSEPDGPEWLRKLLGEERLSNVVALSWDQPTVTDRDIGFLNCMPML